MRFRRENSAKAWTRAEVEMLVLLRSMAVSHEDTATALHAVGYVLRSEQAVKRKFSDISDGPRPRKSAPPAILQDRYFQRAMRDAIAAGLENPYKDSDFRLPSDQPKRTNGLNHAQPSGAEPTGRSTQGQAVFS
jgi:hypothetical protein